MASRRAATTGDESRACNVPFRRQCTPQESYIDVSPASMPRIVSLRRAHEQAFLARFRPLITTAREAIIAVSDHMASVADTLRLPGFRRHAKRDACKHVDTYDMPAALRDSAASPLRVALSPVLLISFIRR